MNGTEIIEYIDKDIDMTIVKYRAESFILRELPEYTCISQVSTEQHYLLS
jgi:hypothetical protein